MSFQLHLTGIRLGLAVGQKLYLYPEFHLLEPGDFIFDVDDFQVIGAVADEDFPSSQHTWASYFQVNLSMM
ncbi:hypothetical protein [Microseira wollei]|uniref:hypothetical protein n=1 Tax=Microseira wollei TaxID=467598 RepID=UPI001CFEECC8|nr:hypothetical protein [Microseira wollei]